MKTEAHAAEAAVLLRLCLVDGDVEPTLRAVTQPSVGFGRRELGAALARLVLYGIVKGRGRRIRALAGGEAIDHAWRVRGHVSEITRNAGG